MAAMTRYVWTKIVFSVYYLLVSGCPSNTNVFTTTGSSVTLQYDANSLSDKVSTYQLVDPRGSVRAQFVLSRNMMQTLNLTFTGDTSTGDISFRIDTVQTKDTGLYAMIRVTDLDTPLLCYTVYITDSLSVPKLTSNKSTPVGASVTLTCSSSSTTVPAGLPLVYTWQVDGATNPADSMYMYSTSRKTLTVSDVQKSDADKVFTCKAQEDRSNITSVSSSEFRIDVLFGPENVRFEPSQSSYIRTENTTLAQITCRADCNPSCTTFIWSHLNSSWSISTAVLDLGQVSRDEAGIYRCTVTISAGYTSSKDLAVIVQFSPLSVTLTGNTSILANGINNVTLKCTTSPANPPAIISWSRNGSPIFNVNPVQETAGGYGGRITSLFLQLTPARDDDGDVFMCTASNTVNTQSPVTSQQSILDLIYSPTITTSKDPSDVTGCTDRLIMTCIVSSKPVSSITWYRGQHPLSTTGDNNVGQYTIINVNRTVSGQYRCVANNGYGGNVQETSIVSVNYAPDVSAMTKNATTQEQYVDILCNPSGVPAQYTYIPWTHQWDINGPILNHPGLGNNPVLRLSNLTYQHSGVYTCGASNGVDCSKDPDTGTGHVYLVVKAAPVLIYPQTKVNNERILLATKVNQFAVFTFTFWSNADNTDVKCYKNTNGTRQNTPVGNTVFTLTTVRLPVFSSSIATTGTLATLSLNIEDQEDLGAYDVVLSNQIGEGKVLVIDVVLQEIGTQGGSNLDAGVIAGSIVAAIVTVILVGVGIFLYRRVECIWKTKARQQVDDVLIMKERPNEHETPIQDASPGHVYDDVDQPVSSSSSGQATGPNEYEQAVPVSNTEHVYTELQQTTREARNT